MNIKKAKLVKAMKFCQLYGGTFYRCKRSLKKHRVPARMIKKCWVEATGVINRGLYETEDYSVFNQYGRSRGADRGERFCISL